jgi:hypothetical protein
MFGKKEYKEAANATVFIGVNIVVWVIGLVLLSLAVTAVWLGVERWRQNRITEIMRQTNQYVTTQQTMMMTWADEYQENKVRIAETNNAELKNALSSQNSAICEQIRQASIRIDPQYVPFQATQILNGGCK